MNNIYRVWSLSTKFGRPSHSHSWEFGQSIEAIEPQYLRHDIHVVQDRDYYYLLK